MGCDRAACASYPTHTSIQKFLRHSIQRVERFECFSSIARPDDTDHQDGQKIQLQHRIGTSWHQTVSEHSKFFPFSTTESSSPQHPATKGNATFDRLVRYSYKKQETASNRSFRSPLKLSRVRQSSFCELSHSHKHPEIPTTFTPPSRMLRILYTIHST